MNTKRTSTTKSAATKFTVTKPATVKPAPVNATVSFIPTQEDDELEVLPKPTDQILGTGSEGFDELTGEWDVSDVLHPQLALKHAIDTRFQDVAPGRYVYQVGAEEYYPLTPPLAIVPLTARKGYREETEIGEIPTTVWSKAELEEIGGTLTPGNPDLRLFSPMADVLLLIEEMDQLKNFDIQFIDVLGAKYAPTIYRVKHSAYRAVAKDLATWMQLQKMKKVPDPHLYDHRYSLGVRLQPWKGTTYLIPSLKRGERRSPKEIKAFGEVAGNL